MNPSSAATKLTWTLGLLVGFLLAMAPQAKASCSTSCTWTGETPSLGAGSSNWSLITNWAGGEGPVAGSNGTLSFPALPSSSCPFPPGPTGNACYFSNNDLTGVSANKLEIDDRSPYQLMGSPITLGAGGIATTATGSATASPFISTPITLGADQTWTIDGGPGTGFHGRLALEAPVTGDTHTLDVDLNNSTVLNLSEDNEVGDFTATGDGTNDNLGFAYPTTGSSLNFTDGNSVSVENAGIYTFYDLALGPLTLDKGTFQLGAEERAPKVTVNGAVDLGSTNAHVFMGIGPSSTPVAGTDYSQISASGNISLGNSVLSLGEATHLGACDPLPLGTAYTLVQTTGGTLTGTFSNAPEGSVQTVGCSTQGGGSSSSVRIAYTPTSVTATAVSTTTITLSPDTTTPVTNQPVTLTADVAATSGSGTPTGTVEFDDNGTAIPGCAAQPLDSSGEATCETSFSASSSPESLRATYSPTAGSLFAGSATTSTYSLTVGKDSTATALTASSTSPQPSESVTYTATVAPGHSGSVSPSGTVQFTDGGSPIAACSSQPLSGSPPTATCTVTYATTSSHSIAAGYAGDESFEGSTAPSQAINVAEAGKPTGPSENPAPPSKEMPKEGGPKKAPPAKRTCVSRVASYEPAIIVKGKRVPGVRVRLRVGSPAQLEGRAQLTYQRGGKSRTADLGEFNLRDRNARNLQLPLPPGLRRVLPVSTEVTVDMHVRADLLAPGAVCKGPDSTDYEVRTKVVRVLAAKSG
jgi:hypothetical protein